VLPKPILKENATIKSNSRDFFMPYLLLIE